MKCSSTPTGNVLVTAWMALRGIDASRVTMLEEGMV